MEGDLFFLAVDCRLSTIGFFFFTQSLRHFRSLLPRPCPLSLVPFLHWSLVTGHFFLYPYLASNMGAVRLSTGT